MKAYSVRKSGGKEAGPFTADALRQMARAGLLPADSEVRCSDSQTWYQVSQVPDLIALVPDAKTLSLEPDDLAPDVEPPESSSSSVLDRILPAHSATPVQVDQHPARISSNGADASSPQHQMSAELDAVPLEDSVESGHAPTQLTGPRPWVRLWARCFDVWVFALPSSFAVGFLFAAVDPRGAADFFAAPGANWLVGIAITFVWVFVEATLLAIFGTTLGKAWLGVRIRTRNGEPLSFGTAVTRSFCVWLGGTGLGIPIVALVTQLVSYSRLTSKGSTWWDDSCGLTVEYRRIGPVRATLFVLAMIALLFVMAALNAAAAQR